VNVSLLPAGNILPRSDISVNVWFCRDRMLIGQSPFDISLQRRRVAGYHMLLEKTANLIDRFMVSFGSV
jgi:hypothetical protein